jgi:SET domain-containing protein
MKSTLSMAVPETTTSRWAERAASAVHGSGLYATQPIAKGPRVIEYVGERITKKETEHREAVRLASQAEGADGCVYVFEINQRYDIDGHVPWNTARLINHSCEPNCEPENVRGHIWIVALRHIAEGEELNYDYGFEWENWEDHPCRCGTVTCLGYIVKKSQRWRVRRKLAKRETLRAKK